MSIKKWHGISDLENKYGKMTFAMFLLSFREADGFSQSEFAKQVGLSRANLCDLEKGRKIPSPERAAKIAKKLGVPEKVLIQLALQDMLAEQRLAYQVELKDAA
ncbi:MAG: helix-turn-helix transcriptional regulator [Bdellovibrionota bacterium]